MWNRKTRKPNNRKKKLKNICHKERKLSRYIRKEEIEPKGIGQPQRITTAWRLKAEEPPFDPNCHGFGGRAFVSVHIRPVSTPSLRSYDA